MTQRPQLLVDNSTNYS